MISEKAHAKLNLTLDVVGKRKDGFHDLKSIMVPLELHDTLIFAESENTEIISNIDIKDNIVLKAIKLFNEKYSITRGVRVNIEKRIPIGGGLAGGSADASATLRGLNRLFKINASLEELAPIALELGSDTLFCLHNKPAYVYGRGEYLDFLDFLDLGEITLICPNTSCSTKEIFANFQKENNHDFEKVLNFYINKDKESLIKNSYNDILETVKKINLEFKGVFDYYNHLLDDLKMTGSGSTMFSFGGQKNTKKHNNAKIIKTRIKN